jgi:hypothetical protein
MKKFLIIFAFCLASLSPFVASSPALAQQNPITGNPGCAKGFLTFPVWYRGLEKSDSDCSLDLRDLGIGKVIWTVALNLLDILLQAAGYIATGFIIYGGFAFMLSQGNEQRAASARQTIVDAAIGLIIITASVAIINFVARFL